MGYTCAQDQVVVEVGDQEQRRGDHGRKHHAFVRFAAALLDEVIASADQNGAGAVEEGVKSREECGGDLHGVEDMPSEAAEKVEKSRFPARRGGRGMTKLKYFSARLKSCPFK